MGDNGSSKNTSGYIADRLVKTLEGFGSKVWVEKVTQGVTYSLFELGFEPGTLKSSILKQSQDLALNLAVQSIRVIPPGPGRPNLWIEIPNERRNTVWFDEMLPALNSSKALLPIAMGKNVFGNHIVEDLTKMPHVLLLGDTGSGKTIFMHSLMNSIIYSSSPDDVKFCVSDISCEWLSSSKEVIFSLGSVINTELETIKVLESLCDEMERRMLLFKQQNVPNVQRFNQKVEEEKSNQFKLPYLVFLIDEFAPLIFGFREQFEHWIKRLTAAARFCGIHLVLSTKYVSRKVVSSVVEKNIPAKIVFKISDINAISGEDSDKLLGRGDFLYPRLGTSETLRLQGAYENY